MTLLIVTLIVSLFALWYKGAKMIIWYPILGILLFVSFDLGFISLVVFALFGALFIVKDLRKKYISKNILNLITKLKLLPTISDTEKMALRAGDVWIDGEFFKGDLDFEYIMNESYPSLSDEEEEFLNTKVDEVCAMSSDFKIFNERDLSKETWQFLKDEKFFGMIIPKEYGGLGFSALGHSAAIQKLATHSQVLAITTMVPNSLGPAELLLHYGTQEQRDHYLPRLADGRDIPCFALTEPLAGSDATSIRANGVLFKDGDEIKIKLNFEKRYITLGAIATLIGLAFHLRDPEHILGDSVELGITCALIDSKLDGVIQGVRHDPLGVPFINSPLKGEDVVIGIGDVIGAKSGVGQGWKMLMESLSVGRGISLPSTSTGGVKLSNVVASSYSTIREQFGVSISAFEGVQDALANLASSTYMLDAARIFTIGAIDSGKKPAVINAVMKYHSTEMFRKSVNDAMDVVGGAGISLGEKNLLGNAYMGAPIAITVEGANIMTRTLIQFGQGVIRCHPYAYKEIEAIEQQDLDSFDENFFTHIGFTFSNSIRAFVLSLSRGNVYQPATSGVSNRYERGLAWSSAIFAFLTDVVMGIFGGKLKQREMLSSRFADILSNMYLLSATIRRFEHEGRKKEDEVFVKYIGDTLLYKIQISYEEIFANLFENRFANAMLLPLRLFIKINPLSFNGSDEDAKEIVSSMVKDTSLRDRLSDGVFKSKRYKEIDETFKLHLKASNIVRKIKKAIRAKVLEKKAIYLLVDIALEKGVIEKDEFITLSAAIKAKDELVQVDSFTMEDYKNRVS